MSFVTRISSFFIDEDEEDEEQRAGNRNSPEPVKEPAGIPGEPGAEAAYPEHQIVPSDIRDNPIIHAPDSGLQVQIIKPDDDINVHKSAEDTKVTRPAENTLQPPSFFDRLRMLISKTPEKDISSLLFDPGELAIPSTEGSLRDVCITYPTDPPYQFVHIEFDRVEGSMIYQVVEPQLSEDEKSALTIIENAFEKLVSTNVELVDAEQREKYLHERFHSLINIFGLPLTDSQKERMYFHLRKQYLGYGKIDTLMKDKYIEDISCNGSDMVLFVQHRIYGSIRTDVKFGEVELNNFVLKLAQISGRHVSLLQPIRDLTLPDGSRANITLGGEVTKRGSTFTIRKFRTNPISCIELMDYGSVDAQQLAYVWILMENKRSILVSGGTATGKTTFLNVLCSFIPPEYKIVSIEDTAELNLLHPNWIQSVTRTGFGTTESSGGASGISGLSGISMKTPGDISLYDL